jgi:two-component system chemotaxis response regulator CheY
MRILLVEDDFGSRRLMQKLLADYGDCDAVVDGEEALEAFRLAWEDNNPYDAIFLDIMIPKIDGQMTLKKIREMEKQIGINQMDESKVIMTTMMDDPKNVIEAYSKGGASSYLVKPVDKDKINQELVKVGLIKK